MPRRKNVNADGTRRNRDQAKRDGDELAASLRAQGLGPREVFAEITKHNLEFMEKDAAKRGRCLQCWQTAIHGCCICKDMEPVVLKVPMKILVWCHARDYLNAGDDAKLLPCCVTGAGTCETLLFGTPDDDRLGELMMADPQKSLLLFPDETAITIEEYLGGGGSTTNSGETPTATGGAGVVDEELTVVVLNGTWGNVKPMLRHFNNKIDPSGKVRHVGLKPDTLSVYQRAQRRMKREVSLERICSVEAIALLLKECGEDEGNCDRLVEYVQLNNAALQGKRALQAWRDREVIQPEPEEQEQGMVWSAESLPCRVAGVLALAAAAWAAYTNGAANRSSSTR